MAVKIMGLTMYGMSEMAKGYNIYVANKVAGTRSELKGTHVKICNTIGKARKEGLAYLKNHKFVVIYKGMNERAEGCMYMDGTIPVWINEQYNYIVNKDGSIRNGVRYR
ncbi:MAG: hypothetical protein IIY21_06450 [Clostridiales bacterium]|nr:hypothetical protein [Clostridiales bacterium]MBQ1573812.1 hypothetical protein [Clostridiales bacterium]